MCFDKPKVRLYSLSWPKRPRPLRPAKFTEPRMPEFRPILVTILNVEAMKSKELKLITLNGQIFVKQWLHDSHIGVDKDPIVLFHDSLGCVKLWRDFPEKLAVATGRNVIAYDRLGFGESDTHPNNLTIDFIDNEIHESFEVIVRDLKINTFFVLGHSVGGAMALRAAHHYKDRCKGVITISSQAFVGKETLDGIREARKHFSDLEQLLKLKKYHGEKALWVLNSWIDIWLSKNFQDWTIEKTSPLVTCPILVIHGDNDEYGRTQHAMNIANLNQYHSSVYIIENCGHIPHREHEQEVLERIQLFLV